MVPDIKLLLPPGLTIAQIADRVGQLEGKSSAKFLDAANSGAVRSRYEPRGSNIARRAHLARHVLHRGQRDRRADPADASSTSSTPRPTPSASPVAGPTNGLYPYQTLVSASLIEAEAGSADDAPLISAVIVNRLKDGHAAPDRRHPLLREGWLPAGPHRRRPQDRLAVQHLQDRRAPAHADPDGERGGTARRR